MSFRQEYLGQVQIISGKLVLMDPERSLRYEEIRDEAKRVAFNTDEQGSSVCDEKAVAFAADAEGAQVFAHYDEKGRITSVEIRIIED